MKSFEDKQVKWLSKKYGVDPRVVKLIERSPIKFYKKVSADDNDIRPVRLRYFGCFMPKTKYIKEFENEQ
jgi:hypothetical protein